MKKNKNVFLILLVFYSFYSQVWAMSEEEIQGLVLKNFPLINEALMKVEASKNEAISATGAFDHKISFKSRNKIEEKYDNQYVESSLSRILPWRGVELVAGHRQGNGVFAPYDGKYKTSSVGEIFMGLSAPLLRNSVIDDNRTNLAVSKIDLQQKEKELYLKKNMTVHKAISLYYKFLFTLKKLEIRKQILSLAEERQQMLTSKYKSGDTEKIKLTDNLRSIDKRKDEILKSEIEVLNVKNQLFLYLEEKIEQIEKQSLELTSRLDLNEPFSFVRDHVYLEKDIPQITLIQLEKEKLQASHRLISQQRLPKLNLEVLGAKELSPNAAYDPENLMVGVKFEFPLENRKASGKNLAQEYKIRALTQQMAFLKSQTSQLFKIAQESFFKSFTRWKTISREVKNTKEMEMAERKKWLQGQSNLYIVSLREQDTADAEIRKWASFFETVQHYLDLKLITAHFIQYKH